MSPRAVRDHVIKVLASIPRLKIDYIELVDPVTLEKAPSTKGPVLLAGAIFVGRTRLIDNIPV